MRGPFFFLPALLRCGEKSGGLRIFCKFRAKIGVPRHCCHDANRLAREPSTPRTTMKKPLAAIASAFLLSCAPAFSLAAAPVPSADPAVVAATKDMLAAMKVRDMMTGMLARMEQQMPAQMRATMTASINGNPNLTPDQKAEQLKKLDEASQAAAAQAHGVLGDPTLVDDMIAEMIPLYAETYTLDEIRQLTAFYTSPLGQKMQAKMPELMTRSLEISQRVMMPRIQKAMAQSRQAAGGK
jgi:uncharacterized protein